MTRIALAIATLIGAVLLIVSSVVAQEKVVLSSPVYAEVGATDFRVESIYLKRDHPDGGAEIRVIFREASGTSFLLHGRSLICRYDAADAETLVRALNTTNLSTISLERRVTNRCQTDGKLGAGSIVGTPQ